MEISVENLGEFGGRTPVLVDDIISSGRTMLEAVRLIRTRERAAPICIAVHGVFADNSDKLLAQAGARVVTTNSIPHETNGIDVGNILASAINELAPMPPRNFDASTQR